MFGIGLGGASERQHARRFWAVRSGQYDRHNVASLVSADRQKPWPYCTMAIFCAYYLQTRLFIRTVGK